MEKRIFLSSPTVHDEEMKYIQEAFDRNWIAPLGFNCDAFEEEMVNYLYDGKVGREGALSVCSCTAAIHLALKLAGVKPGERVFCSDLTFVASANPITYEGGIPVFIDSDRETWNMDPAALEKAFEMYPDTRVVLLVHLYGVPAKMDEILAVCRKHNAILIEDAAEALSATYHGKKCGTLGEYNTISFNGNKIITTSGGGMLICNNASARDKAMFWATQAREIARWYQHEEIGYNYRMSNVVAGIGRGQLLHLEEHRQKKEAIYRRYQQALQDLPVTMNPYLEDTRPNFWLSCITLDPGCGISTVDILDKLEENNVEARPIWKPMHMQPLYKDHDFFAVEKRPVGEDIFDRGLCLPSDIKMTEQEQDYVIALVRSCFEGK